MTAIETTNRTCTASARPPPAGCLTARRTTSSPERAMPADTPTPPPERAPMRDLVKNRCSDAEHDAQQPYVERWLPIETADKSEDATPIDVWQVSTYKGEIVGQRRIADVIWGGEDWVSDEHG